MGIKLIVAPTLEPVSLAEVKLQCAIDADITAHDSFITGAVIPAARAAAENYMGAILMQRTVDLTLDEFPCDGDIETEQPPAWNRHCVQPLPLLITSISYVDPDGVTQVLAGAAYTIDDSNWPSWTLRAVDTEWPATRVQANAVQIRMVKGYDAIAKIPADVRAWLLLTAGFLFAHREAFDMSGKMAALPSRFIDALLDPYRVFKV